MWRVWCPGFSTDRINTFTHKHARTHTYTHVVGESDSEMLEKVLHRMSDGVYTAEESPHQALLPGL